jgi:hypothetical protein
MAAAAAQIDQNVSNLFAAFKGFKDAKDVPTFTKITGLKMDSQSIKNANGILFKVWGNVNDFSDYVRHSKTDAKLALQKIAKANGTTPTTATAAPAPKAAAAAPKAAPAAKVVPTAAPKAAPTAASKGKTVPTAAAPIAQSDVLREILENQATEILMSSGLDFDTIVRERALKILTDSGFNFEAIVREEAANILKTKIGL